MVKLITNLLFIVFLTACSAGPSDEQILATAQTLQPKDENLNAIYQRSCRNCHTLESTKAPLTGDVSAWQVRLEKGNDVLLNNVINGFGGMPPFGLCMDCNAEQFSALIDFMAQQPN
ncbi:c-type cytochrome [Bermanella sp. WJH001]|uniref:c-type cytochrome n=1 Tax=Bermanella sp. WJH001 TaxID=3048005 RepID=UPI0024BE87B4|nr:c-type cytochrome [Bermanella sp. WJH001]MDJ1537368.1 c-type cytochrome [Bermanella sp. WJH001]